MSKIGTAEIHKIALGSSVGLQAYYGDHLIYGKNMIIEQGTPVKTTFINSVWSPGDFCKVCTLSEYNTYRITAGLSEYGYYNYIGPEYRLFNDSGFRPYDYYDDGSLKPDDYINTSGIKAAFANCDNIETLEVLSDSSLYVNAFHNCSNLTDVSIGENVYIGCQVFKDCSSLVNVTLPVDVSYIGAKAFDGTPWLNDYIENYNQNIIYIGKVAYGHKDLVTGNLTIDSSTKSIYYQAFKYTDITSLVIPDSVEFIGYQSFMGCHYLTDISINGTVYNSAFSNCGNLQNVNISDSIYIGDNAFKNCTSLSNIKLSDNLEAIGMNAFQNTGLTSIDIPYTVVDFSNGGGMFMDCSLLQSAIIRGGSGFDTITGNSENTLPQNIFKNCTSLSSVTLHGDIEFIQRGAFENCTALRSIILPKSVKDISFGAFKDCSNINIYILSTSRLPFAVDWPTSANKISDWPSTAKVYVRESLVDSYKNAASYQAATGSYNWAYYYGNNVYALTDASIAEMPVFFTDSLVESICVNKYDTNNNGFVNELELAAASIISTYFSGKAIHSFTELKYFTNVTAIPANAFLDCSVLKTVNIPSRITSIGSQAFKNCSKLTTCSRAYDFENTLTIGNDAFRGSSITSFLMYGVTSVGSGAFRDCKNLTSLPGWSTASYPDYVCMGCSSLTEQAISFSVASIGVSSFQDCVSMKNQLTLRSVETIGAMAFYGTSIDRVWIGSSCTSIGNSAFYNDSLQYVYIEATTPPSIAMSFPSSVIAIAVPDESVNAYKSASDWATFYQNKIISHSEFFETYGHIIS